MEKSTNEHFESIDPNGDGYVNDRLERLNMAIVKNKKRTDEEMKRLNEAIDRIFGFLEEHDGWISSNSKNINDLDITVYNLERRMR